MLITPQSLPFDFMPSSVERSVRRQLGRLEQELNESGPAGVT